jgi:hypothetical protein
MHDVMEHLHDVGTLDVPRQHCGTADSSIDGKQLSQTSPCADRGSEGKVSDAPA